MNSIKIRLILIITFALMGLLLGSDSYQKWYAYEFLDGPHLGESSLVGILSVILYVTSLHGLVLGTIEYEQGFQTQKLREDDLLVSVAQGGFLTGAMMFYGYMAGPISEHGTVLSPWLIVPMSAVLPLIPLVRHAFSTETESQEHEST